MNVAVIGGGYAGMAAAVTLAERGIPTTVFEAAPVLGGRARRVDQPEAVLDNGLHILLGAYGETLRLMRLVGADPRETLLRLPLTWRIHDRFHLRAAALPAPLHLVAGLALARGVPLAERMDAARFMLAMRRRGYRLERDTTVEALLAEAGQGERITRWLWRPLCLSALNTPPERADAQTFLSVLRDGLDGRRTASDLLLPRVDLSKLFPEPAARFVQSRGGTVLAGRRVTAIDPEPDAQGRASFRLTVGSERPAFTHVICATGPYHAGAFLAGLSELADASEAVAQLAYHPIYSVYLGYPPTTRLPSPMLGFDDGLLQWAFDRGALAGQHGVIGVVISATGPHQALTLPALAQAVHEALARALGGLPEPQWSRVIAEKRATIACTPALRRPGTRTGLRGFYLAGDYTASAYPATIESAVRSGVDAAGAILEHAQ